MPVYMNGKNWSDRKLGKYSAATEGDNGRYYKLVKADGTVVQEAVKLELLNPVLQPGVAIESGNLNSILAAKNVTTGTSKALILQQEGFLLEDGAQILFRIHVKPEPSPNITINVNNTGDIKLMTAVGRPLRNVPAGTWLSAIYSSSLNFFVLLGSGGGANASNGRTYWHSLMTNTLNVRGW